MRFVPLCLCLFVAACAPVGDDSAVPEATDLSGITTSDEGDGLDPIDSEQVNVSPTENQTDYDDNDDRFIDPIDAQQVVMDTYPDLNFGEDIMFGPEEVDGVWIPAYMMSATITPRHLRGHRQRAHRRDRQGSHS
ncbi:MAG: hypothetical protein V1664_00210 [Candidatus Uhrbacteria bacterium]